MVEETGRRSRSTSRGPETMEQVQTDRLPYFFTESQVARLAVYKAAVVAGYYNEGFGVDLNPRVPTQPLEPSRPGRRQEPRGR
jgi:hypothetical protein